MLIGIPKEVKDHEYRVGATPAFVSVLIQNGHEVIIQKDAGAKIWVCLRSGARCK